jgi:exonuclease SbcD
MKILHVADLHFGKSLQGKSLLLDQRDWAEKFVSLVKEIRPDAVAVAGDVYDRAAPSGEAVELLDRFFTGLFRADGRLSVFVVSGNHDSGSRLAFGAELLSRQRLHIAGRTERAMKRVVLHDALGPVDFWLMPYAFPAAIQQALDLPDGEAPRGYTEAVARYLAAQDIDPAGRNVLIAHQSVTHEGREAEPGGSETMIGGVGGIDGAVFGGFDYVALGHIHKAQAVGRETVRYAGSPLCYHFDEARWPDKGAVLVELGAKGEVAVKQIPIAPLHPLRVVEGAYEDIVAAEAANPARGEYVKVVLADRRVDPSSAEALRALFAAKGSAVLETVSSFRPFAGSAAAASGAGAAERTLAEKFATFWTALHGGAEPDDATLALIRKAAEQVETGRPDPAALAALACRETGGGE